MDLKKLPDDVIMQIRSSFKISSISQCVTELVFNSLDAKSTAIAVRVNFINFKIQIVDNGKGISGDNMHKVGLRYMTSKMCSVSDLNKKSKYYGFRGETLASIIEVSKSVSISSRGLGVTETFMKTFQKSKPKLTSEKTRSSSGTTVTIDGLFHGFPVRQKAMKEDLEIDDIKHILEKLVFIYPTVSFSLRNDVTGNIILNCQKSESVVQSLVKLCPDIKEDLLTSMKIEKGHVKIEGLLYKEQITKKLQFVYVNKRPVYSSKITKFMVAQIQKNDKIPKNTTEVKHPVFLANISCPNNFYDVSYTGSKFVAEFKNWDLILRCFEKMVLSFYGKSTIKIDDKSEEVKSSKFECGMSLIGAVKGVGIKRKMFENLNVEKENYVISNTASPLQEIHEPAPKKIKKVADPLPILFKQKKIIKNKKRSVTKLSPIVDFVKHIIDKDVIEKTETGSNISSKKEPSINEDKSEKSEITFKSQTELNLDNIFTPALQDSEKKGKKLIMTMFLKSAEKFKTAPNDSIPNGTQDSNESLKTLLNTELFCESTLKTATLQINKTMSVAVKVKGRKKSKKQTDSLLENISFTTLPSKKKRHEKLNQITKIENKCVQTSLISKNENFRLTNKMIQTTLTNVQKPEVSEFVFHEASPYFFEKNTENFKVTNAEIYPQRKSMQEYISDYAFDFSNFNQLPEISTYKNVADESFLQPKPIFDCSKQNFSYNFNKMLNMDKEFCKFNFGTHFQNNLNFENVFNREPNNALSYNFAIDNNFYTEFNNFSLCKNFSPQKKETTVNLENLTLSPIPKLPKKTTLTQHKSYEIQKPNRQLLTLKKWHSDTPNTVADLQKKAIDKICFNKNTEQQSDKFTDSLEIPKDKLWKKFLVKKTIPKNKILEPPKKENKITILENKKIETDQPVLKKISTHPLDISNIKLDISRRKNVFSQDTITAEKKFQNVNDSIFSCPRKKINEEKLDHTGTLNTFIDCYFNSAFDNNPPKEKNALEEPKNIPASLNEKSDTQSPNLIITLSNGQKEKLIQNDLALEARVNKNANKDILPSCESETTQQSWFKKDDVYGNPYFCNKRTGYLEI